MSSTEQKSRRSVAVVRIVVALLLVIHGIARVNLGIVDDFGFFLTGVGFPFGGLIAWGVTGFEIVGGTVLASGRLVRPISAVLVVELTAGIALVHWPEGWFVVGAGRNGMEYSVLLIACLLAVFYAGGEEGTAEISSVAQRESI